MKQSHIPFPSLLSQLTDQSGQVRLQTIKSIMRRRTERGQAFVPLLALLNDPNQRMCNAAIKALGRLSDRRAMSTLAQMTAQHRLARVRLLALKAKESVAPRVVL